MKMGVMHLFKLICAISRRELLLAGRQFSAIMNPFLFFLLVVMLFPLALTPENHLLKQIAPGVIWTGALLANLLGLDRLFRDDFEDGMIEQYILSPYPLSLLLSFKIFMHWFLTNMPLILLIPLLSVFFHLTMIEMKMLIESLLLGTPILILLGAIALAITVKLPANSLLVTLCVIPLSIPILIFGAGSVVSVSVGLPAVRELAILGALLIVSVTFIPLFIGNALRIGVN